MKHLPERLREPNPLIATFSMIASPMVIELFAQAGFEAIVLDMEHGPISFDTLNSLIPAARAAGIHPIVRVRSADASLIGSALDVGAAGILVPQIDSGAAATAVVRAARFAPLGHRGLNPYTRAAGYHAKPEWYARANSEVAVFVMVEGTAGIAALPEILATSGLDGIFIGPFDLSQAMALPGQVEHPNVIAAIESIVASAATHRKVTAIYAPTPILARRWLDLGVQVVALGYDTAIILDAFKQIRAAAGQS